MQQFWKNISNYEDFVLLDLTHLGFALKYLLILNIEMKL